LVGPGHTSTSRKGMSIGGESAGAGSMPEKSEGKS